MKKIETLIIKSFFWILIPCIFFFLFWWVSSSLTIYNIIPVSENQIAFSALTGLFIGICLVLFTNKILLFRFYSIRYFFLIPIYLFCSTISFGIMMGFPLGNIILGVIAGFYIGRRIKYTKFNPQSIFRKTSIFTAFVSGCWVLLISILAVGDGKVLLFLTSNSQLTEKMIIGPIGITLVILVSLIFGVFQFYLTRFACRFSFKI
ncbi:MAG: hypothetical protein KAS53_11525 [Candidatus Cloacimonetes bacterium]|nr:hypothetical protein [Candidatus Cloacimonadota bacterium]